MRSRTSERARRRGAAATELAILLPLLVFLFVVGVDFARIFYHYLTITNCAHNGALYGSMEPSHATDTTAIEAAALADATNLSPTPDVDSTTGTDADGNPYVEVTVTYPFSTITRYPGISDRLTIARTVRMRVAPMSPREF